MLVGTVGAVGGGIMASGGILARPVSLGAGCGVAVLGVGVAGLSAKQAYDGNAALFGPYVSTEGARVLASFGTSTYPVEASPIKEALTETAKFGVIAVAGKLVPKALSAIEGEAVTIKQSSTAVPAGSTRTQVDGADTAANVGFDTSNLQSKLGYLLDAAHPQNQTKATWFEKALGFDKSNWQDLASQLKVNEATAIQTKVNQYGTTFEQSIPIVGANGNTINTTFVFIKDTNGVVRFITGIPTKK